MENIYKFLALDVKTSDQQVLEALQKAKQSWNNKRMQHPKAPEKLAQIKELEEGLASNPNLLAEHRRMYGELQKQEKAKQEKSLREDAQIFVINGEIDEAYLNSLQKKNPAFSKEEILSILGARIKAKRRPRPQSDDKGKLIDRFVYKGIIDDLKAIGKTDLYDFLGLKRLASIADIKARNDQIYTRLTSGSINQEGYNTIKNLTGQVKTWLYTEEKRADYDTTLNNEAFQGVSTKIDQITSTAKLIQPEQYKMLVEECTKKGMSLTKAEALIYDYADSKGVTIVDGGISDTASTCRFCGSINEKGTAICKECGMPLVVTCPQCGHQSTSNEELRCTHCGFNIGDMPLALNSLKEAEVRLGFQNVDGAMQSYQEAERYWPKYKGLADIKNRILSTPPAAPSALKVSVNGKTVNLEWTIIPTKFIQYDYLVIRKEQAAPNSSSDGTQIVTTRDNKASDLIEESGVNYYYAVYTRNGKCISAQGAKSPTPIMIADNLKGSDIVLDVQETMIVFNFKKTQAKSIDIYRDGKKVATITGNTYIDNNLRTGQPYSYRFVSNYADNSGRLQSSSGLNMTITPLAMPKPVELRLTDESKSAVIAWSKPTIGTLVIFQDDKPFPFLSGNKVSLDSMRYTQLETAGTSVRVPKNWSGIRYYLPVSVQGNVGVVGQSIRIISIDTVTGVTFNLDDKKVLVKWQWANCSAIRIAYTIDGSIKKTQDIEQKSSPMAETIVVVPTGSKSITISVMALVKTDKQMLTGHPVTEVLILTPAKVEFVSVSNVKRMLFLSSNEYELTYTCDAKLPCDLHVLVSESVAPANLVSYHPAAVIRAGDITVGRPNTIRMTYERHSKSAPLYFRLIAADRSKAKSIRVVSEIQQIK